MRLKSSVTAIGIVLLAVMFLAAGCDTPISSSSEESGEGTLYQIQGIVIDSVTSQPVEGATVELDSGRKATTDAGGAYLIKDVIPNDGTAGAPSGNVYHLSVWKEGYAAVQVAVPAFDADRFKTDDLFGGIAAQTQLLAAFNEWVKEQEIPTDGASVTTNGWTYTGGGTFIDGEGQTVTYNAATETFDWIPLEVNYTYSYGVGIAVQTLAPLIGAVTGKINVVFAEQSADTHAATTPIKDDVEVWVKFAGGGTYGPVLTKDGAFSIDKLPATGNAIVYTNGFYQSQTAGGAEQFFDGVTSGAFTISNLTAGTVAAAVAGGSALGGAPGTLVTKINDIYVFKAADIAFVAGTNVGNKAAAPLAVTAPITLSFTKDIDPATFTAHVDTADTAYSAADDYALTATWTDAKNVSLTVRANPTTAPNPPHTYPHLPYSSGAKIGDLIFSGKAADGSTIAKNDLPVYTEPALALLKTEVITSPPSRALVVTTGNAVKFTFSKAILDSPRLGFYEADNTPANQKKLYHKVEGAVVYVYIDGRFAAGTDRIAYENIVAAGDVDDVLADDDTGAGSLVNIAGSTKISLRATNLYKPDADRNFTDKGTNPSGAEAYFPVAGNITLTLSNPLPGGAAAYAQLARGGTSVTAAVTASGDVITINPENDLLPGTAYTIEVKIILDGVNIFDAGLIPASIAAKSGGAIEFTTAP